MENYWITCNVMSTVDNVKKIKVKWPYPNSACNEPFKLLLFFFSPAFDTVDCMVF